MRLFNKPLRTSGPAAGVQERSPLRKCSDCRFSKQISYKHWDDAICTHPQAKTCTTSAGSTPKYHLGIDDNREHWLSCAVMRSMESKCGRIANYFMLRTPSSGSSRSRRLTRATASGAASP